MLITLDRPDRKNNQLSLLFSLEKKKSFSVISSFSRDFLLTQGIHSNSPFIPLLTLLIFLRLSVMGATDSRTEEPRSYLSIVYHTFPSTYNTLWKKNRYSESTSEGSPALSRHVSIRKAGWCLPFADYGSFIVGVPVSHPWNWIVVAAQLLLSPQSSCPHPTIPEYIAIHDKQYSSVELNPPTPPTANPPPAFKRKPEKHTT